MRGRRRTTTTERDKGAPPRHPDLIKRAWTEPEPFAFNGRGIVYEQQGRRNEALESYRQALVLKPDFQAARTRFDRLRKELDDIKKNNNTNATTNTNQQEKKKDDSKHTGTGPSVTVPQNNNTKNNTNTNTNNKNNTRAPGTGN